MKRCYLRGRKKKGEKREKRRGGAKKKNCSTLLSIMCILRGKSWEDALIGG